MSNTGVYMNKATQKIKAKGYNLTQFLKVTGISLSSYRRYEKPSNKYHDFLEQLIDDLKVKND
tara:strand:- start:185 stop:373 length:189 start_codon:yes stop_codon:yes gene_type:complete